ncbi:Site-specific recombinase XerD [Gracilibacillus ureilyticus]|uniref:Site-specific recombinase XerD n=1 Tax=Gracilibacillus ureilyticus TaxID=531814 RepID=A0A1H9LI96_9BACI|nr:site-specific integrase [Gracilibacillus ureilyticus]SER11232.1 Site-specific recombinase XerD [Gracilibacillus ureilyticus]
MPYGFGKFLEEQGKSQQTIKDYQLVIKLFFQFIDKKFHKEKELYEINPRDVKDFLQDKLEKGSNRSTVNKYLSILRVFFDYAWQVGKVSIDPVMKIKSLPIHKKSIPPSAQSYVELLELLPEIRNHSDYTTQRKLVYLLALKGLRNVDFQFKKQDVQIERECVNLLLKNRIITFKDKADRELFIEQEKFIRHQDTPYFLITKKHNQSIFPIAFTTVVSHLEIISNDYSIDPKITVSRIRKEYATFLYQEKRMTIENIAYILGIEIASTTKLIRNSLEEKYRVKE